ncbi:PAS sensor protein [uncultured Alistipes sp.]|jgi:predicted RNA methylase|uniref:PAS sensor protein n=1 Tax=uncultured Alistipes sp. TaxID=538949 RepID=UPI0025D69E73|nr:PAS sensor protein [uncultured Alistipes sp.]
MTPIIDFSRWNDELDCAVTVCDTQGVVLYQNRRSCEVNGDVQGRSLIPCHNERSQAIIRRLLDEGGRNVYTIEKNGIRKLIYQTVWRENGTVGGLVEYSMEIPAEMPHYVRTPQKR